MASDYPFDKPDGYRQNYSVGGGVSNAGSMLEHQKLGAEKAPITPGEAKIIFEGRYYAWVREEVLKINDWLGYYPTGGKRNVTHMFAVFPFSRDLESRVLDDIARFYKWSGWTVSLEEGEGIVGTQKQEMWLVFSPMEKTPKPPSQGPFR